jgi:hypothetical protein
MNKLAVGLLLLFVAVLVAADTTKNCSTDPQTVCKYKKKCTKIATFCTKYQKIKHCKTWKKVKKGTKKPFCRKWSPMQLDECGAIKQCKRVGWKTTKVVVAKCAKKEVKKYCVRRGFKCLHKELLKRCHTVIPKLIVKGPAKCDAGYKLVFKRNCLTITRTCEKVVGTSPPIVYNTCTIFNDPHVQGFSKNFEFQKEGDYFMAGTPDLLFAVHGRFNRTQASYAWTGILGAAILPNGVDVVKIYPGNKVVINDKNFTAVNGQTSDLPNGGTITVSGNNIQVFGANDAKVLVTNQGTLVNIIIYISKAYNTTGVCSGIVPGVNDIPVEGLFTTRLESKFITEAAPVKTFKDAEAEKNAELRCKAEKLDGDMLKACIFDLMQISNPTLRKQMLAISHNLNAQKQWGLDHHHKRPTPLPAKK